MPVTVTQLFSSCGLPVRGPVRWLTPVPYNGPGVYAVAIACDPDSSIWHSDAPISFAACALWIAGSKSIHACGKTPTSAESLRHLLANYWHPFETILYVGKAGTSVAKRVSRFYRHRLGNSAPHAGGQRLLTLNILGDLWVYWAETNKARTAEGCMLGHFQQHVWTPHQRKAGVRRSDTGLTFRPFANA